MMHSEYDPLLDSETEFLEEGGAKPFHRKRRYTYEEAVSATGYGWFHWNLLALCGWAVSSDALEILSISFILPPATEDLHLTPEDKGWINSSVFLGMMFGGYVWGTLSDIQGRRKVLLYSLTVNAVGGALSSLAQEKWFFIVMRLISGIGVGGSMPVIFTYFSEFQPKDKRGSMISVLATFWMCGNIFAAGLAWLIIPLSLDWSRPGLQFNSWRFYLLLCILPSLSSAVIFAFWPESPKFTLQKGDHIKALKILHKMHQKNFRCTAKKDKAYVVEDVEMHNIEPSGLMTNNSSWFLSTVKKFFHRVLELFGPSVRRVSVILLFIYFTLSFGYYGLFMWFPELFARMEKTGSSPCSKVVLNTTTITTAAPSEGVNSNIYFEGFLTALSNLPGNLLTIVLIDRVGRKILLSASMVVSGVSVFFIYMVSTKVESLVLSCVFSGISVIGWNALDVLNVELYPTTLRATASGVLIAVGRIAAILANLIFGLLVDVNCAVPLLMVAVFLAVGGLTAVVLPNTTKKDLP